MILLFVLFHPQINLPWVFSSRKLISILIQERKLDFSPVFHPQCQLLVQTSQESLEAIFLELVPFH